MTLYNLFICPPALGRSGGSQFGASLNKAAVNTCVQVGLGMDVRFHFSWMET